MMVSTKSELRGGEIINEVRGLGDPVWFDVEFGDNHVADLVGDIAHRDPLVVQDLEGAPTSRKDGDGVEAVRMIPGIFAGGKQSNRCAVKPPCGAPFIAQGKGRLVLRARLLANREIDPEAAVGPRSNVTLVKLVKNR